MSLIRDALLDGRRARSSTFALDDAELAQFLAFRRGGADAGTPVPVVTGLSSLKNPTVWSAVRLNADAMASMPAHAYRKDGDGNPVLLADQPGILEEPAVDIEFGDWVYLTMASLLTAGNGFDEVVATTDDGHVRLIEPVDPTEVKVREKFTEGSKRTLIGYWFAGERIPFEAVVHIAAYLWPGTRVGLSPVAYQQRQIALGIMAEKFGMDVYRRDGRLSGVLSSDDDLTPTDSDLISRQWEQAVAAGRTPVLGKGSKFGRVSLTLQEAQALDVQRWSAEQVARAFGTPPEILALGSAGQSLTYANRTDSMVHWHQTSLAGWQRRLEKKLTRLVDRPNVYVKLSAAGLLRASTKERYESYAIGLKNRFLGGDEVRRWEDLPARDDLGEAPPEGATELIFNDDGQVIGTKPAGT